MENGFRKGERVRWNWGAHVAHGNVVERFDRRVQRTIEGSRIVRRGTAENPAYLVRTDDGKIALKCGAELAQA